MTTNVIVVKSTQNDLMGEQHSTLGAHGVNPSTGHTNIVTARKKFWKNWCGHRDALLRDFGKIDAGSLGLESKCWA